MIDKYGNVGIGTVAPISTLSINGSLCLTNSAFCGTQSGMIYASGLAAQDTGLAESYPTLDETIEPGDIVSLSSQTISYNDPISSTTQTIGALIKANRQGQETLLGVTATSTAVLSGYGIKDVVTRAVAVGGRVPVKVNLEGGEIKVGDRIALSSVGGIGAKATTTGETIGIALETLDQTKIDSQKGYGKIMIFVNLQWYAGSLTVDGVLGGSSGQDASSSLLDAFAGQVKNALASLGMIVENGVGTLQKLVTSGVETQNLKVGQSSHPSGITIYDQETGQPYCIQMKGGQMVSEPGECPESAAGTSASSSSSSSPSSSSSSATPSAGTVASSSPIIDSSASASSSSSSPSVLPIATDSGVPSSTPPDGLATTTPTQ